MHFTDRFDSTGTPIPRFKLLRRARLQRADLRRADMRALRNSFRRQERQRIENNILRGEAFAP